MASADNDDLCESFKEFCKLAGSKNGEQMTSKACGKLVNDCLGKYNKYNVKGITDASAFSACKEKGKPHMVVTKESCDKLVGKIAHEVAKTKTKNNKLAADDEEVITIKKDMCACIKSHKKPDVKATKTSTTGGVKHLTDTSQYTGSHKERFDAEGKGKGTEGRKEIVDDSGYVGNYRDKGTYDNKKR